MTWWQKAIDWGLDNPAVLGCLAAIGFTQLVKFYWPLRWREIVRHWATVTTAMLLAFSVTVIADSSRTGIAQGVVAALLAPTIYLTVSRAVGLVSPKFRKLLSGDS